MEICDIGVLQILGEVRFTARCSRGNAGRDKRGDKGFKGAMGGGGGVEEGKRAYFDPSPSANLHEQYLEHTICFPYWAQAVLFKTGSSSHSSSSSCVV